MNSKWHILFCDEMESLCPVTEFINQCQPKHQVKVLRLLSLLEEKGPVLPRPYADLLRDGIHELRFTLSRENVRVLYFFCYRKFIVLYNAFLKNTSRVPEQEIRRAMAYRERFLEKSSPEQLEEARRAVF